MAHCYNQRNYVSAIWVDAHGRSIPPHAVHGGHESRSGETLFVARAVCNGDTIPGKLVRETGICYVPVSGREESCTSYQVLTNPHNIPLHWVYCDGNQIPSGALVGGQEKDGTQLYIGRARSSDGSMLVGKFSMSTKHFYYALLGQEHSTKACEILVASSLHPR